MRALTDALADNTAAEWTLASLVPPYVSDRPRILFTLAEAELESVADGLRELILIDSGAVVSACPRSHAPETQSRNQGVRSKPLVGCSGATVSWFGSKRVEYELSHGALAEVQWGVVNVSSPMLSTGSVVDAGSTTIVGPGGAYVVKDLDGSILRAAGASQGAEPLLRKSGVYWLGARPLSLGERDLVCGIDNVEVNIEVAPSPGADGDDVDVSGGQPEARVKTKKIPMEPTLEERLLRTWSGDTFPVAFGVPSALKHVSWRTVTGDASSTRRAYRSCRWTTLFIGRADDTQTLTIVNMVDMRTHHLTAIEYTKGPVDYVIEGLSAALKEIGRARIVVRTDNEPAVLALAVALSKFRTPHETILESIARKSSQSLGGVEHANYAVGAETRALLLALEERLKVRIPQRHAIMSWLVRLASWALNRFCIRGDGRTAFPCTLR